MIWCFDQYGHIFYGSDLYGRQHTVDRYGTFQILCNERKYRYSGTLYTKLRSLLNMMCFNKEFSYVSLGLGSDNCYFITLRYKTCNLIIQRVRNLWGTSDPITSGEFYNKLYYHPNPHFIDN